MRSVAQLLIRRIRADARIELDVLLDRAVFDQKM
jgi:hypothetical protein